MLLLRAHGQTIKVEMSIGSVDDTVAQTEQIDWVKFKRSTRSIGNTITHVPLC